MRKHLLIGTALALLASGAWAADNTAAAPAASAPSTPAAAAPAAAPAPVAAAPSSAPVTQGGASTDAATHHGRHQWTLEEARKKAHERADKLDKMTEDEWNQKQAKRHAWKEKWDKMTPEQQAAYKKSHHGRHHKQADGDSAPATAAPVAQ